MKAMVIGCPGSGKSRFSKLLGQYSGTPVWHLDRMYWNSDRTNVGREELIRRQLAVMENESWILDGNYAGTMQLRFDRCDTVYFLDYGTDICISGIRQRMGTKHDDLPWSEPEQEDEEFLRFVREYRENSRPGVLRMLENAKDRQVFIFSSREEANRYLRERFLEAAVPD